MSEAVTDLAQGQQWRTERMLPGPSSPLHVACVATITGVRSVVGGERSIRYSYTDLTTIGYFCGRDSDPESEFRRRFPVEVK